MKKYIYILLILLVCDIHTSKAYEYFTIYFSDGTKSEAFYAADVDSICYSKLSLDSIAYDNWQVQEIYTIDSIYRYPLAQIDSLSFKDVDEKQIVKDIAHVCSGVTPIYARCETIQEIVPHLSYIKSIQGVEDVWTDNQTLYVKINDWGTLTYMYISEDEPFDNVFAQEVPYQIMRRTKSVNSSPSHQDYTEEIRNMCVINQQYRDEDPNRQSRRDAETFFVNLCDTWGYKATPVNNPSPQFFTNDIYNYDFVFLMTHGGYDGRTGLHWIFTGEQLYVGNEDGFVDESVMELKAREIFEKKYPLSKEIDVVADYLSIGSYKEIRNGVRVPVFYTIISNKWIALGAKMFNHPGKAIVFNTACQSLMGNDEEHDNDNLAKAFFKRGAGLYLGYNQESSTGHIAGNGILSGLINGKSSYASFLSIPNRYSDYTFYSITQGKEVHPILRYKLNPNYKYDICLTHPETYDTKYSPEFSYYKLEGGMHSYMPLCNFYSNNSCNEEVLKNTYGFYYSKNPDMTNAEKIDVSLYSSDISYDSQNYLLKWNAIIEGKDLQSNTTYYYRAYMNDGLSDCYGEIKQFTTKENAEDYEAYMVLRNGTLTFYYDDKAGEKIDSVFYFPISQRNWNMLKNEVSHIICDSSFIEYPINTFSLYDFEKLETADLRYLNTSGITSMSAMFMGCVSLKTLDLTNFDTSNVTNMGQMFYNCKSLESIDVSSFNTENVTNMYEMFYRCSSLKMLDLNSFHTPNVTQIDGMFSECSSLERISLENFNTSNISTGYSIGMGDLFAGCSSLKSLDLSNFDTSKVICMSGMFAGCSSLKSLDLSSFDTSKVISMAQMFAGCSSLEHLNISSFNTRSVSESYGAIGGMEGMFRGCSSLKTLDISHFNTSNVKWGMTSMFKDCSSLTSLDLSSFDTSNIDDMSSMISGCSSLVELNLGDLNVQQVRHMDDMFADCYSLTTIYIVDGSNWYNQSQAKGTNMFNNCVSLVGGQGTKVGKNLYGYDGDGNPLYYICQEDCRAAQIDGGKDNPGLFTAK